ncbi:hypothetical protein [Streptomyces sp. 3214.6]|uniref:hypothetical protein n=1 Tax=Streptomyces sp. 3214.6 TaxID=1882757 RepID=UPI00090AFD6E|nr:hypothetical protein [Streptomyces sp. 3214.6]SHI67520.1 hypothetical protein SAMN05444521_8205 [Streptomyces sp. 3214.6]
MTDQTAVDRVPIARSVRYAVRGLPELPYQYGPGTLVPSEITLTYRAAPDSQLGRVHAYVAGRIHVDGHAIPHIEPYGQHCDEGLGSWPEWLAEEARLHDPDAATVRVPATDQTALSAQFDGQSCPHCPDGHQSPTGGSQPWSAWVAAERDGDGQPVQITVARSAGAHVAESDAQWVRERLNSPAEASALTAKLKRVRDLHRETCILARGEVGRTAFRCSMCEALDAPANLVLPEPADRTAEWRAAAEFVEAMNEGCGKTACDACTTREDVADALRDTGRRLAAESAAVVPGRADDETRGETDSEDEALRAKVDEATATLRRVRALTKDWSSRVLPHSQAHRLLTEVRDALAGPRPDADAPAGGGAQQEEADRG